MEINLTPFKILIDLASQRNTELNQARNLFYSKRILNQVKHCKTSIDEIKNLQVSKKYENKLADLRNKLGHVTNLMDLIVIKYTSKDFAQYAEERIDNKIKDSEFYLQYIENLLSNKSSKQIKPKSYFISEIRKKYINAYRPWCKMFDNNLQHNYLENKFFETLSKNKTIKELLLIEEFNNFVNEQCKIFGRQPGSIISRMRKLKLKPFEK